MNKMESGVALDYPRVDLLGVKISAINMAQALAAIDEWIEQKTPHYICVNSVHPVMVGHDQPSMRAIYNASGLTTPDGMPLVWWLHWHGYPQADRVYGPDLMLAVCQHSVERGYRHYFYGSAPGVAAELAARVQVRFSGLQVVGSWSPPFHALSTEEDRQETAMLAASRADIIWVGTGVPRQDQWMSAHLGRVGAPVLIGVGAAFDFLSGRKRQAPRWIQRSGFEWLYRLISEPGRLWRRYLLGYPRFIILAIRQLVMEAARRSANL